MYKNRKHISSLLIFLAFYSFKSEAQKNITHQQSIWYTYQNNLQFGATIQLTTELIHRRFISPGATHQSAIRERLHFIVSPNFDIAIGFAYFLHSPNNPLSTSTLVVPELRPMTELNFKQIFKTVTFTHRFRTERRNFRNYLDDKLIPGYTSNWRFRYQFGIEFSLIKFKNNQAIGLRIGDELFINAGKNIQYNTFDQNRLYFTLTYSPIKSLTLGVGYINWFQQRSTGIDYYDRDILRFSIIQKLQLKKK